MAERVGPRACGFQSPSLHGPKHYGKREESSSFTLMETLSRELDEAMYGEPEGEKHLGTQSADQDPPFVEACAGPASRAS